MLGAADRATFTGWPLSLTGAVLGRRLAGERALPIEPGGDLVWPFARHAPPRCDPRRQRQRQDRDLDARSPMRLPARARPRSSTSTPRATARPPALLRADGRGGPPRPGLSQRTLRRLARRLARRRQSAARGDPVRRGRSRGLLPRHREDGPAAGLQSPRRTASLERGAAGTTRLRAAAGRARPEQRGALAAPRQGRSGAVALPGLLRPARRFVGRRAGPSRTPTPPTSCSTRLPLARTPRARPACSSPTSPTTSRRASRASSPACSSPTSSPRSPTPRMWRSRSSRPAASTPRSCSCLRRPSGMGPQHAARPHPRLGRDGDRPRAERARMRSPSWAG